MVSSLPDVHLSFGFLSAIIYPGGLMLLEGDPTFSRAGLSLPGITYIEWDIFVKDGLVISISCPGDECFISS